MITLTAATATAALVGAPLELDGVSAASGLEITADGATGYVAGDDSVFLYELDLRACSAAPANAAADGAPAPLTSAPRVARKLRVAASRDVDAATGAVRSEEGIPKKVKHDFEAIALVPWPASGSGSGGSGSGSGSNSSGSSAERLVIFGSGSKAGLRDSIAAVDPKAGAAAASYDARSLMAALRADARVTGTAALNLEAAALVGNGAAVALFNRGNVPGGRNSVVVIQLADFFEYLGALERAAAGAAGGDAEKAAAAEAAASVAAPSYTVVHLQLPPIAASTAGGGASGGDAMVEYGAGVSGASTLVLKSPAGGAGAGGGEREVETEVLLLAASYEATLNEIDDGDVLGSRLALLPSAALLAAAAAGSGGGGGGVPSIDLSALSALVMPAAGGDRGGDAASAAPVVAKIEGVAAHRASAVAAAAAGGNGNNGECAIDALAVTDPDGGASQLLQIRLRVPIGAVEECCAAAAAAAAAGAR